MVPSGYVAAPSTTPAAYLMPAVPVQFVQVQPKGFSITAMVLALVSIFFGFTFFLPIAALIFGIIGAKKEPAGRGMAIFGIVVGGIAALFWIALGGLIFAFFGALFAGSASYTG